MVFILKRQSRLIGERMPYCWKCGTLVEEDAKFCPKCGTVVSSAPAGAKQRIEKPRRRPLGFVAIVLISILVVAVIVAAFFLLPVRTVSASESRSIPYQAGVENLDLRFRADVSGVNITFEELDNAIATVNVSAIGGAGVFALPDLFNLTLDYTVRDRVMNATIDIDTFGGGWPWHPWLHINCDVRIDPSVRVGLNVKTGVGKILVKTEHGVIFDALNLEAVTGGVRADLTEDVVIGGNVSLRTVTGGTELLWENVVVNGNTIVNLMTTTGGIAADIRQAAMLSSNVTLNAHATTGGISFAIEIRGHIGAKIESATTLGGVDVDRQVGFSGTKSPLQSNNYPDDTNIEATLETTTGGVGIDAKYNP
jgi:predicted nucleic acid-binding Zn ribbon protein